MLNRNRARGLAAVALLALSVLIPTAAQAWDAPKQKIVDVWWLRSENGGTTRSQVYLPGKCGAGVSCVAQDTSDIIDTSDWFEQNRRIYTAEPIIASDTLSRFGTLLVRAAGGALADTVTIYRDVSVDGVTWTVIDSIAGHVNAIGGSHTSSAISDSLVLIMTNVASPSGSSNRVGSYTWNASPFMTITGISALAARNFFYIRFRIHMTAGDGASTLSSRGVSAQFSYPAVANQGTGY